MIFVLFPTWWMGFNRWAASGTVQLARHLSEFGRIVRIVSIAGTARGGCNGIMPNPSSSAKADDGIGV